jgi:adenine-specific DNA-methyltransferase
MDKEKAKEEIKKLVEEFLKHEEKYRKMSETDTRIKLIDPLFQSLGWDVSGKTIPDEVIREVGIKDEQSNTKKADYTFKLGGVTRLIVEAKAVAEDLDAEKYKTQVINYAFNKICSWAILTDFEGINIYYVDRITKTPFERIILRDLDNFDSNFERLWKYLSKEAVTNNNLDKDAKSRGIKRERKRIDQQLFQDLKSWRELLSNDIEKNHEREYNDETKDEIVQLIIDRLIFIRKTEDSRMEDPELEKFIRLKNNRIYDKLKIIFKEYDEKYNSGLFKLHEVDRITIEDKVIFKVIKELHHPNGSELAYNFDAIDSDILGNIYEQYLSYILTKKGRGSKLEGGKAHRKEQGIYYTPTYIVDYIVKNTIGELAKNKKVDMSKIKVLDPACGSGSFLIKAFDYLVALNKKKGDSEQTKLDLSGASATYSKKVEILKNNIFGVDLDSKAVEIAQLNLLLKAAEQGRRLPMLQETIKVGNSLIDDISFEENKSNEKFDIIIGNPPWSSKISQEENKLLAEGLGWSKKNINICALFIEKSLKKLKEGGLFGFLLPKVVIKNAAYSPIREDILKNYSISQIIDFGKFPGVASDAIAIIIKKSNKKGNTKISFFEGAKFIKKDNINQKIFGKIPLFVFSLSINQGIWKILQKIEKGSKKLNEKFNIKRGIEIGQKGMIVKCNKCDTYTESNSKYYSTTDVKKCKNCGSKLNMAEQISISSKNRSKDYSKKAISGTQLKKYGIKENYFILDHIKGISYKENAFRGNKILLKRISTKIEGTFTNKDLLAFNTVYSVYNKTLSKEDFLFVLGILNSKLIHFYYEFSYNVGMNLTTQLTIDFLSKVPIKEGSEKVKKELVTLVGNTIKLNENISEFKGKITKGRERLEKEIDKTDKEIDQLVYRLYGLTNKEINIIEESIK